jgi:hypothetical protein
LSGDRADKETHNIGKGSPVFLMDECDDASRVLNSDGETKRNENDERFKKKLKINGKKRQSAWTQRVSTKTNDHNFLIHGGGGGKKDVNVTYLKSTAVIMRFLRKATNVAFKESRTYSTRAHGPKEKVS